MAFLSELATNATARGIKVILYEGNDDLLVAHLASEGKGFSLDLVADIDGATY